MLKAASSAPFAQSSHRPFIFIWPNQCSRYLIERLSDSYSAWVLGIVRARFSIAHLHFCKQASLVLTVHCTQKALSYDLLRFQNGCVLLLGFEFRFHFPKTLHHKKMHDIFLILLFDSRFAQTGFLAKHFTQFFGESFWLCTGTNKLSIPLQDEIERWNFWLQCHHWILLYLLNSSFLLLQNDADSN